MRIFRVITRLNIGGPSIQAISLTTRFAERGHDAILIHGSLDRGEGDMRYLAPEGAALVFVESLCRPIAPLQDVRAFFEVLSELRRYRPTIVHTHMAKAGLIARAAAFVYNLTRSRDSRTLVVHTYHGHVLDGYFSALFMTAVFIAPRAPAGTSLSDAIIAISPAIRRRPDRRPTALVSAGQYRVVPLGFDLAPFAAVDDRRRAAAREALGACSSSPPACRS